MAYRPLGLFADTAAWDAVAPDATPSAELSLVADAALTRFGGGPSLVLTATANAEGHRGERTFPAEDLTDGDELRLWIQSTRVGDGKAGRPVYLELRLASAALGFDDPANTWARLLPVRRAGAWELITLSLDDLPAGLRAAANAMRLTCVDESLDFTCHLDALFSVREEMIQDVETALTERLDGAFTVGGDAVSVVFYHATGMVPPTAPAANQRPLIRLRPLDVAPAEFLTRSNTAPRDFSGDGMRLGARFVPYTLTYALDLFTDQRAHTATVFEGLLAAFAPRGVLVAGGMPLTVEWEGTTPEPLLGERLSMHIQVLTRLRVREALPVVPVQEIELAIDQPGE
ncbi:MAG: hypothetical protein HKN04_08790 [Rhodothermaceae bacterium]|nr:hypothetical protein [Rhodothermaceae bacterium]